MNALLSLSDRPLVPALPSLPSSRLARYLLLAIAGHNTEPEAGNKLLNKQNVSKSGSLPLRLLYSGRNLNFSNI
ncbi:hypothetical protein LC593_32425 [Nostoc sp. CHAB 5844]|nr:hypothetical protein [Nostoc sp. CHAB 5844]